MVVMLAAWVLLSQSVEPQQAAVSPELVLLGRARVKMADALVRMPNYTCLETIERSKRLAKRRKFELIDVLRLEVGMVDGKELFAWPGSGKFEDKELADIVPAGGAIGNGSFASHATSIFRGRVANIRPEGKEGDRIRYSFRVPQNLSGYMLRSGKRLEAIIGYHGSFLVDPATERVTRIEVAGDDIPAFLEVLETEASIDYGSVRIGEQDYWLPTASTMRITDLDTSVFHNEIRFTGCRQFQGESTLSFDDPDEKAAAVEEASKEEIVKLPKDKLFAIQLETKLGWSSSKTGDPVEAILVGDLKDKQQLLFKRGSKVTGRVLRLQDVGGGQIMELQFDSIVDGRRKAPFRAVIYDRNDLLSRSSGPRQPRGGLEVSGTKDRPGVAVLAIRSARISLAQGHRLIWTTLD